MASKIAVIRDAVPLEIPHYRHLVTGHYAVQGSRYSARRHSGTSDWLLIATLSGSGRFGSGPDRLIVGEQDLTLIRPGASHDYGIAPGADRWELLWAHFHPRPHWHDWLAWPEHTPGLMHVSLTDDSVWKEARSSFRRAHSGAVSGAPYAQDLAMNSLESLLLVCRRAVQYEQNGLDDRIRSAIERINHELAEDINVAKLAAAVSLSPSRFAHLFREQVGVSPIQYLDGLRIERAKQLLERTASSISQIAEEVGLNAVHFSLRFKQHTGLSPRAYRKQHAGAGSNILL